MKAYIEPSGTLIIYGEEPTEEYALSQWVKPNQGSSAGTLPGPIKVILPGSEIIIGCYLVRDAS